MRRRILVAQAATVTNKKEDETRWLVKQVRPFWRLHLRSLACLTIASLLALIDPLMLKWLIDDFIPQRNLKWLPLVVAAFFLTYAGRFLFDGLGTMLSFQAIQRMVFKMRLSLLRHLQALSAEYHDTTPVGDTLHRLGQDVDQVGQVTAEAIPALLRIMLLTTLTLTTMLVLNARLTMLILPLVLVVVLVRKCFHVRLKRCSDKAQEESGRVSAFLQEHLSAIVQVQLLTRETAEARRFARFSRNAMDAQIKRKRAELAFYISSALIIFAGIAVIIGDGGYEVITGSLTVGALVAFYGYTLQLFGPINSVVDVYSKLHRARASLRRILEIEMTEATITDHSEAVLLRQQSAAAVEFRNVSFRYRSDSPVLYGMNFRVSPGEKVAIVGKSGIGKTTVAKLLGRLYEVKDGSVLVDGYDVRNIKLRSLRSIVSIVPQDAVLFDGTLLENLRYGNPRATKSEVREAVETAQLDGLVRRLPRGWDARLGPCGRKLSGGERQRVALARALLQNPRILILDEPTSALDEGTEDSLLEHLSRQTVEKTLIIVTHRVSAMLWADRIVVLDRGRIVEEVTCAKQYRKRSPGYGEGFAISRLKQQYLEVP